MSKSPIRAIALATWFLFVYRAEFVEPTFIHNNVLYTNPFQVRVNVKVSHETTFKDSEKSLCLAAVDVWNAALFPYGMATCVLAVTPKISDKK